MRKRRSRKSGQPNNTSTWVTLALMGGLLVGIFAAGDDLAGKLSRMFTSAPPEVGSTEELPKTLEPAGEGSEEPGGEANEEASERAASVEPEPRTIGARINAAIRDASEITLQTIAR